MKATVLIDNSINTNKNNTTANLLTEHGLSIYFEIDNLKYLLDVGASNKFINNANELKINIAEIDNLILSHSHADHTGGIEEFIKYNKKARIFFSENILGKSYFSVRSGARKNISPDYSIINKNKARFIFINSNLKISPSVTLLNNIPNLFNKPKANRTLFVDDKQDDFQHEIALAITTNTTFNSNSNSNFEFNNCVIVSACSHHGILNTLAASPEKKIIAYIGGTHLLDSNDINQYETNEELINIANKIKSLYPDLLVITGHCTGITAKKIFSNILKEKFKMFHTGFSFEF